MPTIYYVGSAARGAAFEFERARECEGVGLSRLHGSEGRATAPARREDDLRSVARGGEDRHRVTGLHHQRLSCHWQQVRLDQPGWKDMN